MPHSTEITANEIIALRTVAGALKALTERLGVREMGPADHIRTKHEVKAFIEGTGGVAEAQGIVLRARARRELWQTRTVAETQVLRETPRQRLSD